MHRQLAFARQRAHIGVVAATAGAADGDDGVGCAGTEHRAEVAFGIVEPHRAAAPFDIAGDQSRGGGDDGIAAPARTRRRGTRTLTADAGRRQHRQIDAAQTFAGAAQRQCRIAVAARRQHAVDPA